MNSVQRKFLIERIQNKTKEKIEELKNLRLSYPSASNYIFKAIMTDSLELRPQEDILAAIKRKALAAKEGENWLSQERIGMNKERTILLQIKEVLKLPDDYFKEVERVEKFNEQIVSDINELQVQLDTIEVRIQLASDKTLSKLINEVDDMGDLSLIDTKMKLLG